MSISNLLEPNNYNIFANSVTTTEISPIVGKLTITNNTNNGTGNITINQTDLTTTANDIQFSNNGNGEFYVGVNPTNNESYLVSSHDLKFITGPSERLRILETGISQDNASTQILALDGTTLVYKTNTVGSDENQTLTNKTIKVTENTIIMDNIIGEPNIVDVIDQPIKTTDNVSFGSVQTIGGVIAGSGVSGGFGNFDTINSQAVDNTATINGINPLTTDIFLHSNVNQNVSIATTPSFSSLSLTTVPNNNIITNILGLNGTSLAYKNNLVDTTSVQTLTNKTLTSPTISTILNTGTLTLPITTGTIALVSQIPTNANFVDLTTNQSIAGIKTFTNSPVISTITNIGTLTLPSTTGTLALVSQIPTNATYVDLTTNQSITGIKTFSTAPVITTISNTGVITVPTTTGTLALVSQIPTNATYVDLTTNQNITGIKTFSTAPIISTITNTGTISLPNITTTLVGRNTTDTLTNKTLTTPIISSISNTGTITLPTATTTLVGRDTTDTLTNKTINSTNNTILINGLNVSAYLDQPVLTTSTVQFTGMNLFSGSTLCLSRKPVAGSVPTSSASTILVIAVPNNQSIVISMVLSARALTGANTGYSDFLYDWKAVNNGGTVVSSNGNNQSKSEANIAGAYTNKLVPSSTISTTNINIILTSTLTTAAINYGGTIDISYA